LMVQPPLLLGIAGGTASGKSTLASALSQSLPGQCSQIAQDWYYRDLAHLTLEERPGCNFDHPDALENELLAAHLSALRSGKSVEAPQYDFHRHTRSSATATIAPRPLLILEGLHVLSVPAIRECLDLAVFIDCSQEQQLHRRLLRDQAERGRSEASIREQFFQEAAPMYETFVLPARRYAHLILHGDMPTTDQLAALRKLLAAHSGAFL